jgi:hypothetical protein
MNQSARRVFWMLNIYMLIALSNRFASFFTHTSLVSFLALLRANLNILVESYINSLFFKKNDVPSIHNTNDCAISVV